MQNRIFFSQEAIDTWLSEGLVDLQGTTVTILAASRGYRITEAVHVLDEVTGAADPHELTGRVKSRSYLDELGAELLETSMVLGDYAYEVRPGWLATGISPFRDYASSAKNDRSAGPFESEEELLTSCLLSASS